jgi:hypothetical protein
VSDAVITLLENVQDAQGLLAVHFLPGYAPT